MTAKITSHPDAVTSARQDTRLHAGMCWSSPLPTSATSCGWSHCVVADWPRNVQHAAWSPACMHCGWSDNVQQQQPLTDWRIATEQTSYQSLLVGLIPSSERASQTDRQNNPPHWFDAWLLALHFLLYNVCCLRGGPFKGSAANGPMGWDHPRTVGACDTGPDLQLSIISPHDDHP
jgi:hypothetical protein